MNPMKPKIWYPGRNLDVTDLWRGCVLYWPMWEGAGDKVWDVSDSANHGTLTSMDPPTDWIRTKQGIALIFDGSNDYIAGPPLLNLPMSEHTIGVLFTMNTTDNDFLMSAGDGVRWWALASGGTAPFEFQWDDDAVKKVVTGDANGVVGNNYLIFGRRFDGEYSLWVDGVKQADTEAVGNNFVVEENIQVGRYEWAGGGGYRDSTHHLVCIWNRALMEGEMRELVADPFCMIRQPVWDWGYMAKGTAAPAGNPWYAYAQQAA